jgi:hypothetical protein
MTSFRVIRSIVFVAVILSRYTPEGSLSIGILVFVSFPFISEISCVNNFIFHWSHACLPADREYPLLLFTVCMNSVCMDISYASCHINNPSGDISFFSTFRK